MTEILFRGKNSIGEWVEGYYFKSIFAGYSEYTVISKKEVKAIYGRHMVEYEYKSYEVIPETIGQYTGLTDKNGKKMFVGDIVAGAVTWQEQRKNGIVTFRNGSFGLLWYRGEIEQFNPFTSMCNIVYEVIGNIHDNPELLKGGAK